MAEAVGNYGELNERDLGMVELMRLTELCRHASPERVEYLVNLYNERSSSLEPVEAHFVARYAAARGYSAVGRGNEVRFEPSEA